MKQEGMPNSTSIPMMAEPFNQMNANTTLNMLGID